MGWRYLEVSALLLIIMKPMQFGRHLEGVVDYCQKADCDVIRESLCLSYIKYNKIYSREGASDMVRLTSGDCGLRTF